MQQGLNRYNKVYVETSSNKINMLLELYEGAIRFVGFAEKVLEERNIAMKCHYVSRAIAIIGELDSALDRSEGGDIVNNLSSLYEYMVRRLTQPGHAENGSALREVRTLLEGLLSAWQDAAQQLAGTEAPMVPDRTPAAVQQGIHYGAIHVAS
jgi:flagellar secretion chaperone FliS